MNVYPEPQLDPKSHRCRCGHVVRASGNVLLCDHCGTVHYDDTTLIPVNPRAGRLIFATAAVLAVLSTVMAITIFWMHWQ